MTDEKLTNVNNIGTWGLLKRLGQIHYFRDGRCIHPTSHGGSRGWLFVERPYWNPAHPMTCPDCIRLLMQEQEEMKAAAEIST